MWLIFALGIVSFLANNSGTCVMDQNNSPNTICSGGCSGLWGREGWQCSNTHPQYNISLCIPKLWLCNGIDSCGDGSDEGEVCGGFAEDRACTNPFTGEAVGWRCKTGYIQCIKKSYLCDGWKNCEDGSDENEVCSDFAEYRTCTNPLTGEANTQTWYCISGHNKCIRTSYLCDRENNCEDGSDEVGCGFAEDRTCKNPFTGEAYGWRCKTGDCEGGEDESFCKYLRPPVLQPGCHLTGCKTCATDSKILTSSPFWNGSVEKCRGCDPKEGLGLSNLPTDITWRRCNDGSCYINIFSCDNKNDCLDGSDELNCPWFTRLSASNTLVACFGVVILCLVIFVVLRKLKVINTNIEHNDVPVDMALELASVDRFITKIKSSTEMDDEMKEIYWKIHQANQHPELISSVNIFFNGLKTSHEITILVLQLEESIHGSRRQALLCLRVSAGSNKDVERLLSYEEDPDFLKQIKKKVAQVTDAFLGQFFIQPLVACFPNIKKWSYTFSKMIMASFKVSLFLWDFAKDFILWIILVGKSDELNASENVMLWLFFFLIFGAQSIMGLYILTQYKVILSLPESMETWRKVFVLIFMFPLTPCLPSLVIFKATVYSTDMAAIVADARNNPSSQPSTILQQINEMKQKHRIHMQIYVYARYGCLHIEHF